MFLGLYGFKMAIFTLIKLKILRKNDSNNLKFCQSITKSDYVLMSHSLIRNLN